MNWEHNILIGMAVFSFFGVLHLNRVINRQAEAIYGLRESLKNAYLELQDKIFDLEDDLAKQQRQAIRQTEAENLKWARYDARRQSYLRSVLCLTLQEILRKKQS